MRASKLRVAQISRVTLDPSMPHPSSYSPGLALSAVSAVLATLCLRAVQHLVARLHRLRSDGVAQHAVLPVRWSGPAFAVGIGGFVAGYMTGLLDPTFRGGCAPSRPSSPCRSGSLGTADRKFHERTQLSLLHPRHAARLGRRRLPAQRRPGDWHPGVAAVRAFRPPVVAATGVGDGP